MKIQVTDSLTLEEYDLNDVTAMALHLNNAAIYKTTLNIPFPYSEKNARDFITVMLERRKDGKPPRNFALKLRGMELIGGISVMLNEKKESEHVAEIGYWLAEPFWGRGYMTLTVRVFTDWVFENFPLSKLTAVIFAGNTASEVVVRKSGFREEGYLRSHTQKDGQLLDCKIYGKLRTNPSPPKLH